MATPGQFSLGFPSLVSDSDPSDQAGTQYSGAAGGTLCVMCEIELNNFLSCGSEE